MGRSKSDPVAVVCYPVRNFYEQLTPKAGGDMTMKRTLRSSMAAAGILVSLTALTVLQSVPLQVSAPALTGRVTSASESAMEGVLVSAEREGSNMTITVISNASGVYAFPQDRLQPGRYDVTIRALVIFSLQRKSSTLLRRPQPWTCGWSRPAFSTKLFI